MACYIAEREVGFDPSVLGFPSIDNCHAIVFVASNGLYGLHALGGSQQPQMGHYAARLNDFITGPQQAGLQFTRLYGAAFANGNRYVTTGGHDWKADWRAELVTYATQVGFTGKIRGYDLTKSVANPPNSAYVEFRKVGDKCEIHVKRWDGTHATSGANTATLTHRRTHPNQNAVLDITAAVTTAVTSAGLTRVHSERLRG